MRSKERLTHTPVSRSRVSASSSASVCTKQNMVAKRGSIIPAPLAWADSRTVPAGQLHLQAGPLGAAVAGQDRLREGVGVLAQRRARLARAAHHPVAGQLGADHAGGRQARPRRAPAQLLGGRLLHGDRGVDRRAGRRPCWSRPSWPPRRAGRRAARSRETITGAPTRALVVKRAAEVVCGESETSTPTSSPSGFSPAATPAARKPAGRACGSSSRACAGACTQRERKKLTSAPPPRAGRASG